MKVVAPHDRPREKLERVGAGGLGDNELLAIVLGHGISRASALELANAVLAAVGGLHGLARASTDDLRRVPGIGGARASQLIAAVEAGRRTLVRARRERSQFITAREVAEFLVPQFGTRPVEQFGVILLDTKHRLLRTTVLSVGTLDASIVHPREVFRAAASAGAAALVLFHNHPSGDPAPSSADQQVTRHLREAARTVDIQLIDHVIVGSASADPLSRGFYSFRCAGLL